jgi:hypothetical protein
MEKQIFEKIKQMMSVVLVVFFLVSATAMSVSALGNKNKHLDNNYCNTTINSGNLNDNGNNVNHDRNNVNNNENNVNHDRNNVNNNENNVNHDRNNVVPLQKNPKIEAKF